MRSEVKLRGARGHREALPWIAVGALVLTAILAALTLQLHVFTVESPSMGTTAPVGSLVVTSGRASIEPADIITFRPVEESASTYTHRVVSVDPEGITTQGDLNATPDPWRVPADQVVGRAIAVIPGLGYALKVLAFTIIGAVLVVVTTHSVRSDRMRRCLRLDGVAIALAVAIAIVKPVTGFRVLAVTGGRATQADVVSTSVLPITVRPHMDSGALNLTYGQTGELVSHAERGLITLQAALHLPWFGWVALAAACLTPAVVAIAYVRSLRREPLEGRS